MIFRNSFLNLFGLIMPLVVAVFAVPILISELGLARFGALTLIWAVVSYFGLFDLGLGRALTQRISVLDEIGDTHFIGPLVATGSAIMLVLGIVSGVALVCLADFGVHLIDGMPDEEEVRASITAMAVAMPAIILSAAFRGVLEAKKAFFVINLVRIPTGIFTYAGPLAAIYIFEPRLDIIAWVLSLGRIVTCLLHLIFAVRCLPGNIGRFEFRGDLIGPLCVTGGWLTVSNIVSPLMGYVDRFMIGAMVSAVAVSYYATPHEIITKFWILPGAVTAVLFPEFSAQSVERVSDAKKLFRKSVEWMFFLILPISLFTAAFAEISLSIWIGSEFSDKSYKILQIMSAGILVNCLAHIPFTLIQAFNRPKIAATIHIIEFPFFVFSLWIGILYYGLAGAALAWIGRMIIDAAAMFFVTERIVLRGSRYGGLIMFGGILLVIGVLFAIAINSAIYWRMFIVFISFTPIIIYIFKNLRNKKI